MNVYRHMDQAALDAGYNNSTAVANSGAMMDAFTARSAMLRQAPHCHSDLPYGPAPRNRIDYLAADRPGPVLIFVHGGYWQMRAKENFTFLAEGPLAHGIHVALPGYTLAPDISLTGIVDEIRAAIRWVADNAARFGGDPQRIYLSGWSAGGHLTAMALDEPAVRGGLAISGIYDLEPIRLSYLNAKLKLDSSEVARMSPMAHLTAPGTRPLMVTCGAAELPELQRQSAEFARAREAAGLPGRFAPLPDHNHFTILEELAHPQGAITGLLRELIAQ